MLASSGKICRPNTNGNGARQLNKHNKVIDIFEVHVNSELCVRPDLTGHVILCMKTWHGLPTTS